MISSTIFFFNDTATTEIYTLSLHDALPIFRDRGAGHAADAVARRLEARQPRQPPGRPDGAAGLGRRRAGTGLPRPGLVPGPDRKSTRLNSSHANISYAVFCLKKKKNKSSLT